MEDKSSRLQKLNRLYMEMIRFDAGDPKRIQHFTKVHSYARLIAQNEGMNPEEEFILEAAAYVHDTESTGKRNGKRVQKR